MGCKVKLKALLQPAGKQSDRKCFAICCLFSSTYFYNILLNYLHNFLQRSCCPSRTAATTTRIFGMHTNGSEMKREGARRGIRDRGRYSRKERGKCVG